MKRYFRLLLGILVLFKCNPFYIDNWIPPHKYKTIFREKIRVKLGSSEEVKVSSPGKIEVYNSEKKYRLGSTKDYFYINSKQLTAKLILKFEKSFFHYKGNLYRGELILLPNKKNSITVINVLKLEEYLQSVVPSEAFSDWPEESLKAQAICSRTYALSEMIKNQHKPFHIYAGIESQMYLGMNRETQITNHIVENTKNLILLYKEIPARTFYHSHSGGKTEDVFEIWGENLEYLKPKELEYCDSAKKKTWKLSLQTSELEKKLRNISEIEDIKILSHSSSGRAKELEIINKKGEKYNISGVKFRKLFSIPSLFFSIAKENQNQYALKGKGSGHGVGLSQWGAYCLARKNSDYKAILEFYFPGTKLVRLKI